MAEMTYAEAIRLTLQEEMRADPRVFLIGTDVGKHGGLFKLSHGLYAEFGERRVIDTPVSEAAAVGAGVGAALMGLRPIVDLHYSDFLAIAMDQVVTNAATMHYLSNGCLRVPMVIMGTYGSGAGAHHSRLPEAWFLNVPGLKIVMPATPADARGLLKSSIADDNPVIFLEHRKLLSTRGPIDVENGGAIPLGVAEAKRCGGDLTLVARGLMTHRALAAADRVKREAGFDVEVIDLRTVRPLDVQTILESVAKTSRLMVVEESPALGGVGSDVIALVAEQALGYLDAPVCRVTAPDTPVPMSEMLLEYYVPSEAKIAEAITRMLGR